MNPLGLLGLGAGGYLLGRLIQREEENARASSLGQGFTEEYLRTREALERQLRPPPATGGVRPRNPGLNYEEWRRREMLCTIGTRFKNAMLSDPRLAQIVSDATSRAIDGLTDLQVAEVMDSAFKKCPELVDVLSRAHSTIDIQQGPVPGLPAPLPPQPTQPVRPRMPTATAPVRVPTTAPAPLPSVPTAPVRPAQPSAPVTAPATPTSFVPQTPSAPPTSIPTTQPTAAPFPTIPSAPSPVATPSIPTVPLQPAQPTAAPVPTVPTAPAAPVAPTSAFQPTPTPSQATGVRYSWTPEASATFENVPTCPPGQFWDGRQCRGAVAPGGAGFAFADGAGGGGFDTAQIAPPMPSGTLALQGALGHAGFLGQVPLRRRP